MSTEIPSISRVPTLWSEGKAICGFIDTVRFHTALRCRKELFMLYKDCTSTGESLYFGFQLFPFSLAFVQSVCITGESSIRKEEILSAVVKSGRSYEEIMNFLNAESDGEKTEK